MRTHLFVLGLCLCCATPLLADEVEDTFNKVNRNLYGTGQEQQMSPAREEQRAPARSERQTEYEPAAPRPYVTWDFETGDLTGWTATGDAFKYQPTYGDNPTERHRGQPSNHQGDFWVGTYEKRPTHRHNPGTTQGDGPKGTLTSASFTIESSTISFLVGGGCDLDTERVELLIDGRVVDKVTGRCNETMERNSFPVSKYMGRSAQIRLVDNSSGGWGHINFDDLRFE